jgi:hypothetical protein
MRAQRGLASQHDHAFLIRVMRVERPELGAGLDLGQARADELTADAMSDESLLDAPPLTLTGFVPLVAKEVERLHRPVRSGHSTPSIRGRLPGGP